MEIRKKLKSKDIGFLVLASVIPVIITFLFMKFISLNLSYAFVVSILVLLAVSVWQSKNPINTFLKIVVTILPLSITYYLLILPEIPGLWIALPFFLIAAISTFIIKNKIFTSVITLLVATIVGAFFIPKIVSSNLTNIIVESPPSFSIKNILTDSDITNKSLLGKVVILDYFGTWCAPCIKEMTELKEIKEELASESFEFIIACTQTAGDTPEKAQKFHEKRKLPFTLAFDYNSKSHKDFKFLGVPGLVILDKKGNIRLRHEGYNEAENLKGTLLPFLKQLADE